MTDKRVLGAGVGLVVVGVAACGIGASAMSFGALVVGAVVVGSGGYILWRLWASHGVER